MRRLIEDMFASAFRNPFLDKLGDGAVVPVRKGRIAFTTDSYVVNPLFFPGGDIGTLAVNGTVNDLAMCGARPLYLSAGFILEEGLPLETLRRIVKSMSRAAAEAGVQLITGDTKVVDRGKGDGIYINTAGLGFIESKNEISPESVAEGDAVIINGDIGRHGIAVMAAREGFDFETEILSDCAPLSGLVMELMSRGLEIHCMRDLTRGGLGSALVEIAETVGREIEIWEKSVAVSEGVKAACEILGLDPLYIANEGRFIAFVPESEVDSALEIMREHPLGTGAGKIGKVKTAGLGMVTMKTAIGAFRVVDMPSGEQLPRIC